MQRCPRLLLAVLVVWLAACGDEGEVPCSDDRPLAVFTAFPAETAAVLQHAVEVRKVVRGGHSFRLGRIASHPIVVATTGIGLVNARRVAELSFAEFRPRGAIFTGVAGSSQIPIGSVAVARRWRLRNGTEFAVFLPWWNLARRMAPEIQSALRRCGEAALPSGVLEVCVAEEPSVWFVEVGLSDDPFGGRDFPCRIGGGDLYGCDVDDAVALRQLASQLQRRDLPRREGTDVVWVQDMETAAVAAAAAAHQVPFLAFRAVSDGPSDPLNLGNSLAQFAAYYRYAAANAGLAATKFLQTLPCDVPTTRAD